MLYILLPYNRCCDSLLRRLNQPHIKEHGGAGEIVARNLVRVVDDHILNEQQRQIQYIVIVEVQQKNCGKMAFIRMIMY